jgi:hypothetical protein
MWKMYAIHIDCFMQTQQAIGRETGLQNGVLFCYDSGSSSLSRSITPFPGDVYVGPIHLCVLQHILQLEPENRAEICTILFSTWNVGSILFAIWTVKNTFMCIGVHFEQPSVFIARKLVWLPYVPQLPLGHIRLWHGIKMNHNRKLNSMR